MRNWKTILESKIQIHATQATIRDTSYTVMMRVIGREKVLKKCPDFMDMFDALDKIFKNKKGEEYYEQSNKKYKDYSVYAYMPDNANHLSLNNRITADEIIISKGIKVDMECFVTLDKGMCLVFEPAMISNGNPSYKQLEIREVKDFCKDKNPIKINIDAIDKLIKGKK